ncbi:activating signal cointegrator 1 complex subunit 1-like [Homarus americanus]|uniref:activating signal cointegrator 1 complex subunit 1-like n=1 Tax=Homarus americanus TaxID=6706 RepID=UPI001C459BFD|nr:activating signal cointegrator 1 complex subunit 1-like [Homarus americanus]
MVDFLRPKTVWVDGRCYRIISPLTDNTNVNYVEDDSCGFEDSAYQDEVECGGEQLEEFQVEQLNNGKYQTSFPVANTYISYVIGAKGATKKRIENETYTTLRFPGKGQSGDVVVIGKDVRTVRQARLKIQMLVEQARKKQPFTHFLSIPYNNPAIQTKFLEFKKEVLEKCGDCRGVDEAIFQYPGKLHQTLCVMVLADDRERQQGLDALNKCPDNVLKKYLAGEKLRVEMRGIEYMNDNPGEVDVLYGRINALSWSHSLQTIADSLVDELVKAGVVNRQHERVKLHITLMNTAFRQDPDGVTDIKVGKDRESFNARQIIEEFGDYYFGEMEVDEIHLSVRHTTANSGFYSASGKIPILPHPA